jgi:ATP-dependent protease ClpP protease subunit/phage major head subunit gpT-like protein
MADTARLVVGGEILLYGDVGDPYGWGDGFTPTDVAEALAELDGQAVTVRINSPGGIAFDGMAIYSLLKTYAGEVTTVVDGIAASAASLIFMAGAKRQVRDGAMVMIHDASVVTFGNADRHVNRAGFLDKLSDQYAGVYEAATGGDRADMRALMKAETWFSANEAVSKGLATELVDEPAATAAAFDWTVYAHAPAGLPQRVRPLTSPAAVAALSNGDAHMSEKTAAGTGTENDNKAVAAGAEPAGKVWAADFYAGADRTGLSLAKLNEIVQASASKAEAKEKLIDAMVAARDDNKPAPNAGRAAMGADASEKFVEGATLALSAKSGLAGGERNEFSGLTLRELARMSLERRGVNTRVMADPLAMIGEAMSPVFMSAGLGSTSDFVNILANVANKSMLKGFGEAEETFESFTAKGVLTDFKPATRVDLGLFPNLLKVEEGVGYEFGSTSDRKETIALATYGRMFAISRQAIINDDLAAFSKIPGRMGRAAKRTIGNLVFAILTGNPNMSDGVALFHASHNNLLSGGASPLAIASLDAARSAMAKQKDPDGAATALNIKPKTLLVPVALQGTAGQLIRSETDPTQANPGVKNKVANMVESVVADARLDVNSATAWYLAAGPNDTDTIEVAYLDGVDSPVLEQQRGWNVDGVEFKIRLDAGVAALGWRGLLKSAGA